MSARDDHHLVAGVADLLCAGGRRDRYGLALNAVLDELDQARTQSGAVGRIEALRLRARTAEAAADQLARHLRTLDRTPPSAGVLALYVESLKARNP